MGGDRFAVATALATFLLLIAGGLVSTTESGLACPDWPLCQGQFIPKMIDGKQFEHTHRLVASFVATMTFGLCALLFKYRRSDCLLTRLGVAAALLVIVQALLGALTVKLRLPAWVSSTHQATAMAFFSLGRVAGVLDQATAGAGRSRRSRCGIAPVAIGDDCVDLRSDCRWRRDAAHARWSRLRLRFPQVSRPVVAAAGAPWRASPHDPPSRRRAGRPRHLRPGGPPVAI